MKLRPLPTKQLIQILGRLGFEKIRQRGSHVFFRHPDGRTTIVPVHKGETIGRGLLLEIVKDTKLTKEEFLRFLD